MWRAIISSSFVGITHAETLLPFLEIRGPLASFVATAILGQARADAAGAFLA